MYVKYILYKSPVQLDTLAIVQYLASLDIDMSPFMIYERGYPEACIQLPSIFEVDTNLLYSGLKESILFFEKHTGISNLLDKALEFKAIHPEYRINDFKC